MDCVCVGLKTTADVPTVKNELHWSIWEGAFLNFQNLPIESQPAGLCAYVTSIPNCAADRGKPRDSVLTGAKNRTTDLA